MKFPRRVIILFLLFIGLPVLACNLPVGPRAKPAPVQAPGLTFPSVEPPGIPPAQVVPTDPAASGAIPINPPPVSGQAYRYRAQPGDSLAAVAAHFGVDPGQVHSTRPLPTSGLIPPGQELEIEGDLQVGPYPGVLLPDSEVVDGPAAAGFDIAGFIQSKGGYLSTYTEQVGIERLSGAEIVRRLAVESSTNPRLLLGILDYTSNWVSGQPKNKDPRYPVGFYVPQYQGLDKELSLVVRMLSQGYYGWRDGSLANLEFIGGQKVRISPQLNAGTVAVQFLFTKLLEVKSWQNALYGQNSFSKAYALLMGDPWARAEQAGPVFPAGEEQPTLELPFAPGQRWSLTGGPHISWGVGSPRGAIDLAPVTGEKPCVISAAWALASANAIVARSERNELVLDLDGDGQEQTGWVLFYYHLAEQERVPAGTRVKTGDRLGHPSCQGTRATGTHVHIARKYNGEWLSAGEPLPMVLSGWTVHLGAQPYQGTLTRDDQVVTAQPDGSHGSIIMR